MAGWGTPSQAVLPVVILAIPSAAYIARLTRTFMLEVLHQDFIRTAHAKRLRKRLVIYRHAFRNTLVPLVVITSGGFDFWASLRNAGLVAGVLSCLTYFFFSVEHRGLAGRVSRLGIWFLMITFGASFAFTVMGRIALLASRLEFLFYGWLSLKSPLFPF